MNDLGLLLALGFGNGLMLSWLAAAAVPLVIHLWNRRRYREISWAAVDFLLAAMRKNARRIQLEQLLLLAIRTLIIVLVALAVAEPYLEGARLSLAVGQAALKVLVIDGSFSMQYRPTDKSRFEAGQTGGHQNRGRQPAGRRLFAGHAGRAARGGRRGAGPRPERFSGRDRQSSPGARPGRFAGNAGLRRRAALSDRGRWQRASRAGAEVYFFSDLLASAAPGPRSSMVPKPKPSIASAWPGWLRKRG